jgi:hypothetical protein
VMALPISTFQIIFLLFAMKLAFPEWIHILRGNHESERCTTVYGFKNEVYLPFYVFAILLYSLLILGCR